MADIRINALATTAASTASDDFIAVDGSANGTRKLDAFSPTFGGNLTVSGTVSSGVVTSSFADALSSFTRTGLNGAGAAGVLAIATDGKTINDAISFAIQGKDSANNTQTYGQIKATIVDPTSTSEDSTFTIQTVTAGSLADAAVFSQSAATLTGNLTVSGTGTSSFAGNVAVTGTGTNYTAIDTGSFAKFGNDQTSANLQVGSKSGVGAILQGAAGGSVSYPLVAQPYGGNFLIGTAIDGGQKLQVSGEILSSPSGAGYLVFTTHGSKNTGLYYNGSQGLVLYTNTNPALTLDSSQNATFAGTVIAGTWASGTADKLKVTTAVSDYAAYFANIASSGGSYGIRLHTNTTAATDYLLVATSGAGGGSTRFIIKSDGTLNAPSLPTSSAGLSAGDIWNDGGTLKIVQP